MNALSVDVRAMRDARSPRAVIGQEVGSDPLATLVRVASIAGVGLGAYHGYMRHGTIPWAIGWGLLGGLAPIITIPVALAQGFGKRAR